MHTPAGVGVDVRPPGAGTSSSSSLIHLPHADLFLCMATRGRCVRLATLFGALFAAAWPASRVVTRLVTAVGGRVKRTLACRPSIMRACGVLLGHWSPRGARLLSGARREASSTRTTRRLGTTRSGAGQALGFGKTVPVGVCAYAVPRRCSTSLDLMPEDAIPPELYTRATWSELRAAVCAADPLDPFPGAVAKAAGSRTGAGTASAAAGFQHTPIGVALAALPRTFNPMHWLSVVKSKELRRHVARVNARRRDRRADGRVVATAPAERASDRDRSGRPAAGTGGARLAGGAPGGHVHGGGAGSARASHRHRRWRVRMRRWSARAPGSAAIRWRCCARSKPRTFRRRGAARDSATGRRGRAHRSAPAPRARDAASGGRSGDASLYGALLNRRVCESLMCSRCKPHSITLPAPGAISRQPVAPAPPETKQPRPQGETAARGARAGGGYHSLVYDVFTGTVSCAEYKSAPTTTMPSASAATRPPPSIYPLPLLGYVVVLNNSAALSLCMSCGAHTYLDIPGRGCNKPVCRKCVATYGDDYLDGLCVPSVSQ